MKTWTVYDVMTAPVVTVGEDTAYRELVDVLMEYGVSAVPVVDAFRGVLGVVSEADLLRKVEFPGDDRHPRLFDGPHRRATLAKAAATTARDLMSRPAVTASSSTPVPAAARLMDSAGVRRLPVIDELGRLIGIVSRGDLLKVHLRPDADIRADVCDEILTRILALEEGKVVVRVRDGLVALTGRLDRRSAAENAVRLSRQVAGVVDVIDQLDFDLDDAALFGSGAPVAVA
jgi:CBS domain-containing protein